MTANVSTKTYTCDVCGKTNNNAGNHGRHVKTHITATRAEIAVKVQAEYDAARAKLAVREIPKTHGGYRPGSGRKPRLVGIKTRAFVLDEPSNARIEQFRKEQGLVGDQDASEALRRIIAIAVPL